MRTSVPARKNRYRQHRANFLPSKPRDEDFFGKYFAKMGPKASENHCISDRPRKKSGVKAFPMKWEEKNYLAACEWRKVWDGAPIARSEIHKFARLLANNFWLVSLEFFAFFCRILINYNICINITLYWFLEYHSSQNSI